ncbi:MAG: glutamate--tRNA ligase, partial [Rhodobacter sp.]|nr:glutamate--tRNA ligase [Rhodobacter sp.]
QIQIIQALGGAVPAFAHHSLLTGPQGEALSKRLGVLALRDLREQGVEPMALLSLMARLGSSDPVELRGSMDELIDGFDITRFGAAPTKFDEQDLFPLTARHLSGLGFADMAGDIAALGVPEEIAERFWNAVHENITVKSDMAGWWAFFRDGAQAPLVAEEDREFVLQALALLPAFPYDSDTWSAWTNAVKEATGRKGRALFMPLRKAITGREKGPEMADVMALLQAPPRV